MKSIGWLLGGFIVWGLVLSGCSLTKPRPEVRHYALALNVPQVPSGAGTTPLVVRLFSAHDPYTQERIVYRTSPFALDFYNYHRWAASPAEMVTDWTRRYLRGTGLFANVLPTSDGNADVALGAVIRQFEEIDQGQTWEATLSVDFWLTQTDQRSPFWSQSYTATQPAARRNPEAIAAAMSRNLENILEQL
ncbi:MAG: ABC-type transport auxiliary lipoprotein family protein, partial [Candidatus Binatia bacterium]